MDKNGLVAPVAEKPDEHMRAPGELLPRHPAPDLVKLSAPAEATSFRTFSFLAELREVKERVGGGAISSPERVGSRSKADNRSVRYTLKFADTPDTAEKLMNVFGDSALTQWCAGIIESGFVEPVVVLVTGCVRRGVWVIFSPATTISVIRDVLNFLSGDSAAVRSGKMVVSRLAAFLHGGGGAALALGDAITPTKPVKRARLSS